MNLLKAKTSLCREIKIYLLIKKRNLKVKYRVNSLWLFVINILTLLKPYFVIVETLKIDCLLRKKSQITGLKIEQGTFKFQLKKLEFYGEK